jgi:hypothetical protein
MCNLHYTSSSGGSKGGWVGSSPPNDWIYHLKKYCSKNIKSPLNLYANQHLHCFSPSFILILHPPLTSSHLCTPAYSLDDEVPLTLSRPQNEKTTNIYAWCPEIATNHAGKKTQLRHHRKHARLAESSQHP